ncbi:hypothetical protein [Jatrophihabitans sp.]|uniref:hypothetical protein n=1 Tax=Jatrophihabitans sp. TaxID=1932789 RepID=UPI0030C6D371|nr:diguanylate phosphodiesterase [Jatrophihabitans sp.]
MRTRRPLLLPRAAQLESSSPRPGSISPGAVGYAPVLDTERGVVAGYSAQPARGRALSPGQLAIALRAKPDLPRNTFLTVPLEWDSITAPEVQAELLRPSDLSGIIFELIGVGPAAGSTPQSRVAASVQEAGGLIALYASDIWHPDFRAVTAHQPHVVVLGASWVRRIDQSPKRHTLIETLGEVAGERDAWVLGSGVATTAELTTLARLGVPLLRGPAVGTTAFAGWAPLAPAVTTLLGPQRRRTPGPMRQLLVQTPTTFTIGDAVAGLLAGSQRYVAVVDRQGRPCGLAIRTEGGIRASHDVLCVHVDTALDDVRARVAARDDGTDPVAAVDSAGRLLGLVPTSELKRA